MIPSEVSSYRGEPFIKVQGINIWDLLDLNNLENLGIFIIVSDLDRTEMSLRLRQSSVTVHVKRPRHDSERLKIKIHVSYTSDSICFMTLFRANTQIKLRTFLVYRCFNPHLVINGQENHAIQCRLYVQKGSWSLKHQKIKPCPRTIPILPRSRRCYVMGKSAQLLSTYCILYDSQQL